jgi:hypothetical protein
MQEGSSQNIPSPPANKKTAWKAGPKKQDKVRGISLDANQKQPKGGDVILSTSQGWTHTQYAE